MWRDEENKGEREELMFWWRWNHEMSRRYGYWGLVPEEFWVFIVMMVIFMRI